MATSLTRPQAFRLIASTSRCVCLPPLARPSSSRRSLHTTRPLPQRATPAAANLTKSSTLVSTSGQQQRQRESKLETLPFHLAPSDAQSVLDTAAGSAFGLSSVLRLLASRFLRRFFGIELDTGVERRAFRAVLLPTWRVDLALTGRGLLGEEATQMELHISAINASIPGFHLAPLHNLTCVSPWSTDPVSYNAEQHSRQHGLDVTVLPFSLAPLKLLAKIAGLPRTNVAKHGIGLDPAAFKTQMFAAYPLYIPAYLGEYESDGKRVTAVAFAASDQKAFAIYPTFLPDPSWLPTGDAVEVSVGGSPVDFATPPPPNTLKSLKPKLDELLSSVGGPGARDSGEKMVALTDSCEQEEWEQNPRVMRYSLHAEHNREYIEGLHKLATADAMSRQIDTLDENVRGLIITPRGPKMATRDVLVADTQKKLEKAKRHVALSKPQWLVELEEAKRVEAAKGYGRGR